MTRTQSRTFALGVDIGGTFTDAVIIESDGTVHIGKGISTPDAFERGIFRILDRMLEELGLAPGGCHALVHGTTVATNAIIERKGAVTGLITTKGFRDVLELRRIRIPRLYDLTWQKPEPLVARYLREEVTERMTHDGRIHTALDAESAKRALANLVSRGVTSIAVCLMNSYELIAFGGNGGLFAGAIARELELTRVIVPHASGIFSAFGALYADVEHHLTQTVLGRTDAVEPAALEASWHTLEKQALDTLRRKGYGAERCRLQRLGELRYYSQTHELAVPWPGGPTTRDSLERLAAAFEDAHERTYGHRARDSMVELVNLHLVARGVPDTPRAPAALRFAEERAVASGERSAYFGKDHGWLRTPVCARAHLERTPRRGPVIVQEFDATILVPPEFEVAVDDDSNIVMAQGG